MSRRVLIAVIVVIVELAHLTPESPVVHAQIRIFAAGVGPVRQAAESELSGHDLFVTDRRMTRRLARARELLRKNDRDRINGLSLLQSILDNAEDVFFTPDAQDKTRYHGLKAEVQRIIAALDSGGRRLYELQYGSKARQMLREASESRDVARLEEVARRFFHTAAGYEATYMLGSYHLDHSHPLAAVLNFDRLRKFPAAARRWEPMLSLKTAVCWGRIGMPEQSVQTLVELKRVNSQSHITLGGRRIEFFNRNQEALDWLVMVLGRQQEFGSIAEEKWAMFRGNAARNAVGSDASPILDSPWQFSTIQMAESKDPKQLEIVEAKLKELEKNYRDGGFLTLPAVHPLVIDGAVIVRSFGNIKAVDPQTGELLWETVIKDPSFQKLLDQGVPATTASVRSQQSSLSTFLTQRAWRDMTAGTLSSDGKHVFAIEELGFLGSYRYNPRGPQHPMAPKGYNKLVAFELAGEGRAAWAIGGETGEGALDFAGTFFLGPPLPLRNQLYCLAEVSGEIRLLVLEPKPDARPATAKLSWSQSLILPQASLLQYPLRRLAGVSPSYADGVMVCPTAAGAVVAVDLGRRELLWGYRYPTNMPLTAQNRRAMLFAQMAGHYPFTSTDNESRWLDAVPTLAEGRALLTPRDSNDLHCLNLADGALQWKRPRDGGLYVAAVHNGKVVVVGRGEVSALRLADGKPAWKGPTPIPMPSGRGVATDGFYHLPLSTGEIATLDLDTGRILARSKLRPGRVPGNLAAAGGMIVSQSIDSVFGFSSLDALNDRIAAGLKKKPDDADALALRGEMRLHRGEEAAGMADLRRSVQLKPTPRPRTLLAERLLDGLRADFAKNRKTIGEIEKLLDNARQRARFLRLHAAGLHQVGEHQAAFAEYLKLAGPETGKPQLERISASLSSRSDRWVRPRIAELYRNAPAKSRAAMDRELRAQLETARKQDKPEPLEKFLNCFTRLPIAEEARRALVDRLDEKNQALQLAFQLRHLRRSKDPALAGFATARLAPLLLESNRPDLAANLVEELTDKYKDVVCLDKKKGALLAEEWKKNERIASALAGEPQFAKDADASSTKRNKAIGRYYPVTFDGPRGDAFENWALVIDQTRQNLIARDGDGNERWRVSIKESAMKIRNIPTNYYRTAYYARVHGHLLVVVLANHFLVVDTLAAGGTPRILWNRDLYATLPSSGLSTARIPFFLPFGGRAVMSVDPFGRPMGKIGPISDDMICYQVGTRLYAANPFNGEILWERRNVARGSDLFGDKQHVLILAPGAREATVLRASDGEFVATRPMPADGTHLSMSGRRVLMWDNEDRAGKGLLAVADVLTGETIWKREFTEAAKIVLVEGDEVAVFEPAGRFTILALEDGQPRVDCPVQPDADVSQITVRRSRDRYVLLSYHPESNQNIRRAVPIDYNNPLVNGHAYGFDRRTGRKVWTTLIQQQAFDLNQPDNLPILVFTVRHYQRLQQAKRLLRPSNQYAVAILDKRNGQIIFEHQRPQTMAPFELKADREKQTIDVNFLQMGVTITFGNDQPAVAGERT